MYSNLAIEFTLISIGGYEGSSARKGLIMETQLLLQVKNLSFAYGDCPVLSQIDLELRTGDFAALIGVNGAGKSTLLKLILGELQGDCGHVSWFGQDIRQFRQWPSIGYVPQHNPLSGSQFPATVMEIVMANQFSQIGLFRMPGRKHRQKTMEALGLVGMESYAGQMIGRLSGGQQQRVMLARALVADPAVLLLDEPTTGIDSQTSNTLYALLSDMNRQRGMAVLMITHDIQRATQCAGRILQLQDSHLAPWKEGNGHASV